MNRKVKKKPCVLCRDHIDWVDYKDVNLLRKYMSDRGKIRSRRVTGNCAQHQRDIAQAIKTARELVLLPYTQRTVTERPGPAAAVTDARAVTEPTRVVRDVKVARAVKVASVRGPIRPIGHRCPMPPPPLRRVGMVTRSRSCSPTAARRLRARPDAAGLAS